MKRVVSAAMAVVLLAGCAAVPKKAALGLATDGGTATSAMSGNLLGLAEDVASMPERRAIKMTLDKCRPIIAATPQGKTAVCDPVSIPAGNTESSLKLQKALKQRAEAYAALGKAYEALAAEANYDARGDMEGAVGELFKATNALGATFGLGQIAIGPIAEKVGSRLAGLGAEAAQKERLVDGSMQIRRAVEALRAANAKESELYSEIALAMADNRAAVENTLYQDGLLDPKAPIQAFLKGLGYTLPAEAKATDPRLIASARTLAESRAAAASRAQAAVYGKTDAVLTALIKKHEAFENDSPGPDLERSLDELRFWTGVLAGLRSTEDSSSNAKAP